MVVSTDQREDKKDNDHKSEEVYMSTIGDNRWSNNEFNHSKKEQDVEDSSDEEIKAFANKVLLNFQLRKIEF